MYAYRERLELENGTRACTAFENVAGQAGEMAGSHWHDAYELLLVQQGRCVQRVGTAGAGPLRHSGASVYPGVFRGLSALADAGQAAHGAGTPALPV